MPESLTTQECQLVQRNPGEPDRQYNPDAAFAKQFAVGCLVLFVAFLLLAVAVWWFWMQR